MSKKRISSEDWATEFQAFLSADALEPPPQTSTDIVRKVSAALNPSALNVFSKMVFIHVVVGFLVLLICPQFGIAVFDGMGLMSLFFRYGETVCTTICGAIFLGGSTLTASLVLAPEEIRAIKKTALLQLGSLALLSIGVFICLGATVALSLGLVWVIGSIAGGLATFNLGCFVRSRFRRLVVYGI